jgi:hypothetical protein
LYSNAGTGAALIYHGHVVPADCPLEYLSVFLHPIALVSAGDFALPFLDSVYQVRMGDKQISKE